MAVQQDTPKPFVSQPTPGPWAYDGVRVYAPAFDTVTTFTNDDGVEVEHRQGLVALPYGCGPIGEYGPALANARLIAAAPELLAACLEAYAWIAYQGDALPASAVKLATLVRAAITKAEDR